MSQKIHAELQDASQMEGGEPQSVLDDESRTRKARKGLFLHSALSVVIGSLCCVTPLMLVLFGLVSLSTAVSMDRALTGEYVWIFPLGALLFLALALVVYFRRGGVCTLNEARRQRNRIINTVLVALLFVIGSYTVFQFIVLAYLGAAVGMPWRPERSALPVAGVLLAAAGLIYSRFLRSAHKAIVPGTRRKAD
jgi:hypothetical protein